MRNHKNETSETRVVSQSSLEPLLLQRSSDGIDDSSKGSGENKSDISTYKTKQPKSRVSSEPSTKETARKTRRLTVRVRISTHQLSDGADVPNLTHSRPSSDHTSTERSQRSQSHREGGGIVPCEFRVVRREGALSEDEVFLKDDGGEDGEPLSDDSLQEREKERRGVG